MTNVCERISKSFLHVLSAIKLVNSVTCALKENSGVIIEAVVGEGPNQVRLIESARKDGGNPLDIFDTGMNQEQEPTNPADFAAPASPVPNLQAALQLPDVPSSPTTNAKPAQFESGPAVAKPAPQQIDFEEQAGAIRLVVCCRQHNPAWVKAQARAKLEAMTHQVNRIPIGSPMRIRTSSGVFETILLANWSAATTIRVRFPDGKEQNYSYSAIIWKTDETRPGGRSAATDFVYGMSIQLEYVGEVLI